MELLLRKSTEKKNAKELQSKDFSSKPKVKNVKSSSNVKENVTKQIGSSTVRKTDCTFQIVNEEFFNEMTDYDPAGKDILITKENYSKHLLPIHFVPRHLNSGSNSNDSTDMKAKQI